MTTEQQARDFWNSRRKSVTELRQYQCLPDTHDEMIADLAAFARHLSSQAPGNLSEEDTRNLACDLIGDFESWHNTVAVEPSDDNDLGRHAFDLVQTAKHRNNALMYLTEVIEQRLTMFLRDHYLSGWVAVSSGKLPAPGQEVLILRQRIGQDPIVYVVKNKDGNIDERVIAWMPIPPYTPQQEQR